MGLSKIIRAARRALPANFNQLKSVSGEELVQHRSYL
jgi:hypothetical protein